MPQPERPQPDTASHITVEPTLQYDMFLGDYVDNRSTGQKRRDRERQCLQQTALFSINEMVQLSANARPWLNDMPRPSLQLEIQDVRTDEEIERDLQRQAEALTQPMFGTSDPVAQDNDVAVPESSDRQSGRLHLFAFSRETLLTQYPRFKSEIEQLSDAEIERLGRQLEAALQPIYTMVLTITVAAHLLQRDLPVERESEPTENAAPM